MSMEDNLNKLVEIGQATRDEQGRYTLNIAADNREIIKKLLGWSTKGTDRQMVLNLPNIDQ
jgi:hypothetical protein